MTKKPPAPSDIADKFMLRMPDGMRDRIAALAKANGRSMNAEIVHHLQSAIDIAERVPVGGIPVDAVRMQAIVKAAGELSRLIQDAEDTYTSTK